MRTRHEVRQVLARRRGQGRHPRDLRAQSEFESGSGAAKLAFDAEMVTTRQIYDLVELATDEKNYIALDFLQWFVSEQLEEVSKPSAAHGDPAPPVPACSWSRRTWLTKRSEREQWPVVSESGGSGENCCAGSGSGLLPRPSSATDGLPVPERRRVTWRPTVDRTAPEQVRKLAGWGLTQNDIASFVGCSQSLISLGF